MNWGVGRVKKLDGKYFWITLVGVLLWGSGCLYITSGSDLI